jgi:hypothetical protein
LLSGFLFLIGEKMDIRDAIVDYLDGKIDLEGVRKIKQSWNPDLEEPNLNSPVIRMYMEEYGVNAKEALKIRRREIDELNRGMKEYYQTEYYEKKIDCLRQSMELKFVEKRAGKNKKSGRKTKIDVWLGGKSE